MRVPKGKVVVSPRFPCFVLVSFWPSSQYFFQPIRASVLRTKVLEGGDHHFFDGLYHIFRVLSQGPRRSQVFDEEPYNGRANVNPYVQVLFHGGYRHVIAGAISRLTITHCGSRLSITIFQYRQVGGRGGPQHTIPCVNKGKECPVIPMWVIHGTHRSLFHFLSKYTKEGIRVGGSFQPCKVKRRLLIRGEGGYRYPHGGRYYACSGHLFRPSTPNSYLVGRSMDPIHGDKFLFSYFRPSRAVPRGQTRGSKYRPKGGGHENSGPGRNTCVFHHLPYNGASESRAYNHSGHPDRRQFHASFVHHLYYHRAIRPFFRFSLRRFGCSGHIVCGGTRQCSRHTRKGSVRVSPLPFRMSGEDTCRRQGTRHRRSPTPGTRQRRANHRSSGSNFRRKFYGFVGEVVRRQQLVHRLLSVRANEGLHFLFFGFLLRVFPRGRVVSTEHRERNGSCYQFSVRVRREHFQVHVRLHSYHRVTRVGEALSRISQGFFR